MTGFELPPQTVDERERRLVVLEAAEETAPRFERPGRPAHAYARHSRAWLAQHLNHENAAAPRSEE